MDYTCVQWQWSNMMSIAGMRAPPVLNSVMEYSAFAKVTLYFPKNWSTALCLLLSGARSRGGDNGYSTDFVDQNAKYLGTLNLISPATPNYFEMNFYLRRVRSSIVARGVNYVKKTKR